MMRLPISTQITVTELIRFAWLQQGEWQRNALFDLFISLLRVGCDYYDLIALYAEHEISESELNILNAQAPLPETTLPITPSNIKRSIFRWTASKYHTDYISSVVEDIYRKLLLGKSGMTVYNSNHNPRSKTAVNERYILLITQYQNLFLDINRKMAVQFYKE